MKHIKRTLIIVLFVSAFLGGFFGSLYFFGQGTYEYNVQNISVFDEEVSKFYLKEVDENIIFRVTCEDESVEFSLCDIDGVEIDVKSKRVSAGIYDILPPKDGYQSGEQYTLSLGGKVSFYDDELKEADTLVFVINKENVARYLFTEDVIETKNIIQGIGENLIDNSEIDAEIGTVIFGKDEAGNYTAYKVIDVIDGVAVVDTPAIDEIYSELEVYGEYTWDVKEIVLNPEINAQIVENVRKSEFYESLIMTAYAAETPEDEIAVSVDADPVNNTLKIGIEITLKAGEKGLFGDIGLKHQNVTISLNETLQLTTKANIQGVKKWDVSATMGSSFSWEVNIGFSKEYEPLKDKDLKDLFGKTNRFANLVEYHKHVRNITEKLDKLVADVNAGEIKLFDWKIPVYSVPGLYFDAEIKIILELDMVADVVINQSVDTLYTVGVCFFNDEFETYSNQYSYSNGVNLSLRGKAKAKAGLGLEIGATLINSGIANISIDPEVGIYVELYVTMPISGLDEINSNSFAYSYFEPGVFFSTNVDAILNIGIKEFEFEKELIEKKYKVESLTFGNEKIALGLSANAATVRAIDRVVLVPDILFEYYDVKKGIVTAEKLELSDIKFVTSEGMVVKASQGKITLPDVTTESGCYITATYLHKDGRTYSTIFKVLISGSVLEGKVSAYDSDMSTQELVGATVKVYKESNRTNPIGSVKTDETGKFSFNVESGDYVLVISAEGYRTLTSNQSVDEDEIKYTEHILLMDENQMGEGSAGGLISNALTGRGISGVAIKLRNEWNNRSGAYVEYETVSDSSGRYILENIPVGYYTVEASLEGYVTGYTNVIVLSDTERRDFDFTITPLLDDAQIRIVLTWGSNPNDLDSHLLGYTPSETTFNVYYQNKRYAYEGVEMANLDVDDTSSYGPETITILENVYGTYTYVVHDYTNRSSSSSKKLSLSNAVVRVFVGSQQVEEYHVPTDQVGTYWTVFRIDEMGDIVPINTISNTKPEP